MEDKKPFGETKVGKLVNSLKGLLPEKGVLGIVKNLIDQDDELTPEEKIEAQKHVQELYKAEVSDKDSARKREVEIAKAGKNDFMMSLTGIAGLLSFLFVAYVIVFMPEAADSKAFMRFEGIIEGIVISNLFSYYYGTSFKK